MDDQKNINTASVGKTPKAKCQLCKFVLIFSLTAFLLTLVVTVLLHRGGSAVSSETPTATMPV